MASLAPSTPQQLTGRHLPLGRWALLLCATTGAVPEALHGFKVLAYLDANHAMRRLIWRLGRHAHYAVRASPR